MTKLLGNIPAGFIVERYGRKPFFTLPMGLVGLTYCSLAFVSSFEELCATRLVQGICVAALTSSATMSVMDVGTKLNMTRTIAPVGMAFNAGITIGPAMGGFLVSSVGMNNTFLLVGGSFLALMCVNQVIITETAPKLLGGTLGEAVRDSIAHWKPLIKNVALKDLLVLNGAWAGQRVLGSFGSMIICYDCGTHTDNFFPLRHDNSRVYNFHKKSENYSSEFLFW